MDCSRIVAEVDWTWDIGVAEPVALKITACQSAKLEVGRLDLRIVIVPLTANLLSVRLGCFGTTTCETVKLKRSSAEKQAGTLACLPRAPGL